jgi:predicted dehydrogenase
VPIYQSHPRVGLVVIADADPVRLAEVGQRHGIHDRYPDLEGVLADDRVDAVHLLTPVGYHAADAIEVLRAGRHCACAVPMATSLVDLDAIIDARERARRVYMMMETSVYGREYLAVEQLHHDGQLGEVTAYRGFHLQNLDGFPRYWQGYPPMAYSTHALSPVLALLGTSALRVQCLGSGLLEEHQRGDFDNPFPTEMALFRLRDSPAVADVCLSFFQLARAYTEGFCVYGNRVGVEWPESEGGPMTWHELLPAADGRRGRPVTTREFRPPDFADRLPESLAAFTLPGEVTSAGSGTAVRVSGGHGGSHPHLVHEFVTSIVEGRPSRIDARTAAAWTAPGIVAHQSALRGGEALSIPDYELTGGSP